MNKVILIGRLTRDPELKKGVNDNSFATFTLAVNRPFTNNEGEREADFINCIAFGKTGETLVKYTNKGHMLAVAGRLQVRNYTAQDGTNRVVSEVVVENVYFLEKKQTEQKENKYEPAPYDIPNPKYANNQEEKLPF